jgi:hypothetical protein
VHGRRPRPPTDDSVQKRKAAWVDGAAAHADGAQTPLTSGLVPRA